MSALSVALLIAWPAGSVLIAWYAAGFAGAADARRRRRLAAARAAARATAPGVPMRGVGDWRDE